VPISSPRASAASLPGVPLEWSDEKEHRRQLALTANAILQGRLNNVISVTLTASSASTTITDARIGLNTALILVPTTANASAEIGAGTIYQTFPNATKNQAVINHANNAQTDRTFRAVMIG